MIVPPFNGRPPPPFSFFFPDPSSVMGLSPKILEAPSLLKGWISSEGPFSPPPPGKTAFPLHFFPLLTSILPPFNKTYFGRECTFFKAVHFFPHFCNLEIWFFFFLKFAFEDSPRSPPFPAFFRKIFSILTFPPSSSKIFSLIGEKSVFFHFPPRKISSSYISPLFIISHLFFQFT